MSGLLEVRNFECRMRILAREGNDRFRAPHSSMRSSIRLCIREKTTHHIFRHNISNKNSTEVVAYRCRFPQWRSWGVRKPRPTSLYQRRPWAVFLDGSLGLGVKEDVRLLLVSALGLDGQLGGHFCGVVRRGSGVEERSGWWLSKMRKIRCPWNLW